MDITPTVRSIASRQHGLVTRAQLAEQGINRDAWYRAHRLGHLVAMAPRVASLPGAPPTPEQRILAAVLTAAPGAVASHRSAAYLWGCEWTVPDNPVDLTFIDRSRSVALPWIRAHTPTDVVDLRPVVRRRIPVTNPLRTIVDLGQVSPNSVLPALEHFLVSGTVSRGALLASLQRHARKGRNGVSALRAALDRWAIGDKPPDSVLEVTMASLLREHGLPPAVFHLRVLGLELDFAFPAERVDLECDGWEAHGRKRAQFEEDRRRDAALSAAGWVVLRFTWPQITRRPGWVAESIQRTLAVRAAA